MSDERDVIYYYDGTFDGLMCCVFESYLKKEIPLDITAHGSDQLSLSEIKFIETNTIRSERVIRGISKKISEEALLFIKYAFLTCAPNKDVLILDYIRKGLLYGRKIEKMLADDTVNLLNKAVYDLTNESHLFKGFIRFSDSGGYLSAVISPKNKVIPLLADHFVDRLRNEKFFIYDKSHRMALVYFDNKAEIMENIDFEMPDADEREKDFRMLWREFYDTIEISERRNPRCRMNNMPKRFWENMTEMNRSDAYTGSVRSISENNYPMIR